MTLTEFLLARIADDEAAANDPEWLAFEYGIDSGGRRAFTTRVLAECGSKRQVVEDCAKWERMHREASTYMRADDINLLIYHAKRSVSGDTLRALALPYADHPDYQQEWRP